jgi:hypothetical protein
VCVCVSVCDNMRAEVAVLSFHLSIIIYTYTLVKTVNKG